MCDGAEVGPPARQLGVAGGFRPEIHTLLTLGVVAVIVVLVDGEHRGRHVDDGKFRVKYLPNRPIVPMGAAKSEWGQVVAVEATGEGEVVDKIRCAHLSSAEGEVAEFGLPGGAIEGPGA